MQNAVESIDNLSNGGGSLIRKFEPDMALGFPIMREINGDSERVSRVADDVMEPTDEGIDEFDVHV